MPLSRYLKNDYLLFAWGDSTERFHARITSKLLISPKGYFELKSKDESLFK